MLNRYSLADHTMVLTIPDELESFGGMQLKFGGPGNNGQEGSFVGAVTVERSATTWTTEADPTGSWVHNKTLDRSGSVTLQLRQVSDDVIKLMMLAQIYEKTDRSIRGCTIVIFAGKDPVARADDCYISKIPAQVFGETAAMQDWGWTAGRVTFPQNTKWN